MRGVRGLAPWSTRRALAGLVAAWLVFLLAEEGPHLVHHLLDTDGEPDCHFLAAAEHAPPAVGAPAVVPYPVAASARVEERPAGRVTTRSHPTPARAPPALPAPADSA